MHRLFCLFSVTGIDMGHLQEHLSTPDATQTSENVTGLQPGTLYRVHLSAVNKAGKGQAIFLDRKTRPSGGMCYNLYSYIGRPGPHEVCVTIYIPR